MQRATNFTTKNDITNEHQEAYRQVYNESEGKVLLGDFLIVTPSKLSIRNNEFITFLGMEDISEEGKILKQHLIPYSKVKQGLTYFEKNDVLVAKITPCFENGKGACLESLKTKIGFGSTEFHVLRANSNSVPKYLFYQTQSQKFRKQLELEMVGTAGQKRVSAKSIAEFPLALKHSMHEQKAIAQALSDVDDLISALDALIEKKRNIKQGTMQELLTGKRRLPGFSGEWETKCLYEVANIIDPHPSHRAPPEVFNGVPFVGIGDISTDGNVNKDTARLVGDYVYEEHNNRYDLNNGLIGIGRVASIGKIVKFRAPKEKYTISPTIAVIDSKLVNKDYLYYQLSSREVTEKFNKICSGSTRQSVGMHVLRQLSLTNPKSSKEQLAIAQVLLDMDTEIEKLEQQRNKTKLLKQGMMQELLTGKTRLL
jgi:type I restriction enzyme S subunit